jgi:hypothetical protein
MIKTRTRPPCLQAALGYLQRGWSPLVLCPPDHAGVYRVHADTCAAPGESPLWPWEAYQHRRPTAKELCLYWNRTPHGNLGIALGAVSGLIVLALKGRVEEDLPETLEFAVPEGGRRLLYALPPHIELPTRYIQVPNSRQPVRCFATGSYTVLPPSRYGREGRYIWRDGHSPSERSAALVPQWLIERVFAPGVQGLPPDAPEELLTASRNPEQPGPGAIEKNDSGEADPELTPRLWEACDFLRNLLSQGPVTSEDCIHQARAAGIRPRTLRRAKHLLHIQSLRKGHGRSGEWLWYLSSLPLRLSGESPCVASAFVAPETGRAFVGASTAGTVMNVASKAPADFPRDIPSPRNASDASSA